MSLAKIYMHQMPDPPPRPWEFDREHSGPLQSSLEAKLANALDKKTAKHEVVRAIDIHSIWTTRPSITALTSRSPGSDRAAAAGKGMYWLCLYGIS